MKKKKTKQHINILLMILACLVLYYACSGDHSGGSTSSVRQADSLSQTTDNNSELYNISYAEPAEADSQTVTISISDEPIVIPESENIIVVSDDGNGESEGLGGDYVSETQSSSFDYSVIPNYSGNPSVTVNDNIPFFSDEELSNLTYGTEVYPSLDNLGRCGVVYGCLGMETMPAEGEERGYIGMIKPSGWHTVKYPDIIDDLYLYNRCHLIGWQLGGENDNERNLITGTRYLNVRGMLPYENQVADYIKGSGNHVAYRVTPCFVGDELLARGVLIEAKSLENNGICFCVWCYNVQPGIVIDYQNGDSYAEESGVVVFQPDTNISEEGNDIERVTPEGDAVYLILNKNTKRAHLPGCPSVDTMKPTNRVEFYGTIEEVQNMGYVPCGNCHPF